MQGPAEITETEYASNERARFMPPLKKIDSKMLVQLSTDELRLIVMQSVEAVINALPRDDKLLSVEQVCEILNVSEQWIYHNAKNLPFVRKVGGLLRFSNNGLQRYIEGKKFTTAKVNSDDS
jgi:excisionase family DNA binding protein